MNVRRVYLNVAPPVGALGARAFREVDLLLRVRSVERILLVYRARVAVECNSGESVRGILHLCKW